MRILLLAIGCYLLLFSSCKKETPTPTEPKLVFKLKFDSTQQRLDAFAQPASIPSGNAAQHPQFNGMSIHNIELVPNEFTPIQGGDVVFKGAETSAGGANAVDFDNAIIKNDGEVFFEIPLSQVTTGTYKYIRTSVTYQNYDVVYNVLNVPSWPSPINLYNQKGTVASFVGFNTYLTTLTVSNKDTVINDDKLQGFWAFETKFDPPYSAYDQIYSGDAPGTTVVNPIHNDTPIPAGSCLVTGTFSRSNIVITGDETTDIVVEHSYSTNNSFEWKDDNGNGQLDVDVQAGTVEQVVDMGLRGLSLSIQ